MTDRERAGRERRERGRDGGEREIQERKMLYLQEFFMNCILTKPQAANRARHVNTSIILKAPFV